MLRPRFLRGKFLGSRLMTFDLHRLFQCVVLTAQAQALKMRVSCRIWIVWQCASYVNSTTNTGLYCIFLPVFLQ